MTQSARELRHALEIPDPTQQSMFVPARAEAPARLRPAIATFMRETEHRMVRACSPSILPIQRDYSVSPTAEVSVSVATLGSHLCSTGAFKELAQTIASAHGSDYAWTLASGTTQSNHVVGAKLAAQFGHDPDAAPALVSRNAHLSVLSALDRGNTNWRYLPSHYLAEFEAFLPATIHQTEIAVTEAGSPPFVWLSSPTYEGVSPRPADYRRILDDLAPSSLLGFDQAWGAHFDFHPELREYSAARIADWSTVSVHKTGGALQGAAALLCNGWAERERLDSSFRTSVSTSPSYPILGSIEIAYAHHGYVGPREVERVAQYGYKLRDGLRRRFPALKLLDDCDELAELFVDPHKVTFALTNYPTTGLEVAARLSETGVDVEKASKNTVTFLMTYQMTASTVSEILDALQRSLPAPASAKPIVGQDPFSEPAEQAVSRSEARSTASVSLAIQDTVGKVAGERVSAYPPGVPIIVEGDRISESQVRYLMETAKAGARLVASHSASPAHEIRVL